MSHVAISSVKAGSPLYRHEQFMDEAAALVGLERVNTNEYNWYQRSVGDYPTPKGMKVEDLGHNAKWVYRLNEEKRKAYKQKHHTEPYDIGVVEDTENEGCFNTVYDSWGHGHGLDAVVGSPVQLPDGGLLLAPKLKQAYDIICERQGAIDAGDVLRIMTLEQARLQYPEYFGNFPRQGNEADTWVSCQDTAQRIPVR